MRRSQYTDAAPQPASGFDDGVLALTLAVTLMLGLRFVDYAYDDAYITYRYARNLAMGHGFVYNLGQDFLGTTTPLLTLLLAGASALLPIPLAGGLISLTSLLGAILCTEILGRQAGIRFSGSAAGLFLMTELQIYQIFGGETLLVYFLLLPAGLALHQSGRPRSAALLFGMAILGRMDALLFVGLVYLRDVIQHRRLPFIEALCIAGILIPWFAYSLFTFGQLFPATLATKMAMGESGAWKLFFPGSHPYLSALNPYQGSLAPVFLGLLLLGLWRTIRREAIWLFFVASSLLMALIYQWILASAFSHWYLASLYLTQALLLGAGLREIWALIGRLNEAIPQGVARPLTGLLRISLLVVVSSSLLAGAASVRDFDTQPPRRKLYTELGTWLHDHTRRENSVAYFEIGYLGWFSQRSIVDPVGLVTAGGLEHIRRGQLHWIFDLHAPDYFIHNSRQGMKSLLSSPAFRSRYRMIERFDAEGYPGELTVFKRNST